MSVLLSIWTIGRIDNKLKVENKDNFRYNDFIATGAWWNWYTRTLEVRMPYGLEVRVPSRPFTIMVSIA